ncbi:LuxR family maltose regulon positive regulatory protein [Rhodococcus sp. OK519]|uniref:helix-turn-helix transcriptional regulator n=1 Tax=Rhodococcus sp. OK519 TaxID=2135729 RepID=UPI000D33211F|nr:LuxR family maltose regulon positive regulatory protein [Rhodococcus sp. OK519]
MTEQRNAVGDETTVWAPSRLISRLQRNAGLTVVRAPQGFGKSSLATAWHRFARDAGRTTVVIAPPEPTATTDGYWTHVGEQLVSVGVTGGVDGLRSLSRADRPVDLILERIDRHPDPDIERQILDLVDDCASVNVMVTVVGRSMFDDPLSFGPEHHTVRADDLLYTLDDIREMFAAAGVHPTDPDVHELHRRTGGLSLLATAVLAATRSARPLTDVVLGQAYAEAITSYVRDDVLGTSNAELRTFMVSTATAYAVTVELARYLGGGPDAARYLRDLEAAGILDHLDTADGDAWQLPTAVRTELLAVQRAEGMDPSARSTLLALHHRDRGEHAAALRCAAESENWDLTVELFDQHGAELVNRHLELLRNVLLVLPGPVIEAHPAISGIRDLVRHLSGDHSDDAEPYDTADLLDLTVAEDPRAALSVVGNRILLQRIAGDYASAADQTRRLNRSIYRLLDAEPDAITDFLPFLRMQMGLTYQLSGDFAESTVELRRAHRLGTARSMNYISRNAAGNSALNWAFAGELQRAHDWLVAEEQSPAGEDWTEALVRIGGAVARVLTALGTLDVDTAGKALDTLGELPAVAELWPFVAFARCRYSIAAGRPVQGLTALTECADARARANGAFVSSLLDATEIEVHLALGDARRARILADSLPCDTPWAVVAVARTHLLTGDYPSAITTCRRYDWLGTPYTRAHLESLVIEAVAAFSLDRRDDAGRAWSHACTIADRAGIRSAFATVDRQTVISLDEQASRPSPTLTEFLATPEVAHYPPTLLFPLLTDREKTVLDGVARGLTVGQIAALAFLSASTVKTHKRTLYRKLNVHSRAEALSRARSFGFLDAS